MFDFNEFYFDVDGDGADDTAVKEFDFGGDGDAEGRTTFIDSNGDGLIDVVYKEFDINNDGYMDIVFSEADVNGDGVADVISLNLDTNLDGVADIELYAYDYDGDGKIDDFDIHSIDDKTGPVENKDDESETTQNEIVFDEEPENLPSEIEVEDDEPEILPDEIVFEDEPENLPSEIEDEDDEPEILPDEIVFEDEPENLPSEIEVEDDEPEILPDEIIFEEDEPEVLPDDVVVDDTDVVPDNVSSEAIDVDGDGVIDGYAHVIDTDGNGTYDTIYEEYDLNHDGFIDEEYTLVDTDDNGSYDAEFVFVDVDYDGTADVYMEGALVDSDGDGEEDTYIFGMDEDMDGTFDVVEVYDYDAETGVIEYVPSEDPDFSYEVIQPETDTFEPVDIDDGIIGDPEESMEHWEYQGQTNRCALFSQLFVIEEITGQELDIEEFADIAEENGWFSESNGTPMYDMNKMLDYYGVENTMSFGNDINDIIDCLENDGHVIVAIDADEIWFPEDRELYSPDDAPDHAVQVIGIDNTDPDNPMVILNDSGHPEGCGSLIPLDVFVDAWEDSDCQMIAVM